MTYLTDFADQAVLLPVVLAIAIMLALQGWRHGAVAWLGVASGTLVLMLAMKLVCLGCTPVFGAAHIHSPSGHVAAATIVAGGLAMLLVKRRAAVLAAALCTALVIGMTRLALHLHTPPEVVLGALVGLGSTAALLHFAGPPPPTLRPGRLLGVVALIGVLLHGLHLPAEAAIRHTALHTIRLLSVCRLHHLPDAPPALARPD